MICEVREGLGRVPFVFGDVSPIVVVLPVWARDELFHSADRAIGTLDQLEDTAGDEVNALWRIVAVESLRPLFAVHLCLDILTEEKREFRLSPKEKESSPKP
jgi:hypothetical protein